MSETATKEEKAETKEKKEKEKTPKEPKKIHVKSMKANPNAAIVPHTGTRFQPDSARQLAFDIVYNGAKEGKSVKEIRKILEETREEKGAAYNLDIGYVNFVVASHPEMFEVYDTGVIKILKHPEIDKEAAKKWDEERAAKKKKAEEAREKKRKEAEGGGKSEKSEKKEEKAEKKEKKHDGEKPSKKEKES